MDFSATCIYNGQVPSRRFAPLAAVLLLAAGTLHAQTGDRSLRSLWLSGRYDDARGYVSAHRQAGERSPEFLSEAALALEQSGDYAGASELYAEYAAALTAQPELILQARTDAWRCAARAGLEWLPEASRECAQRLANTAGQNGRERQLALELDAALRELQAGEFKPAAELRSRFPLSALTQRDAKAHIDRISREQSNAKRIAAVKQFLADYPGNYWRHAAYRLWMYSCWREQSWEALRNTASSYQKEFPQSPEAAGAVSRYFLEAGIEPEKGLTLAQASKDLYEKKLGMQGGEAALRDLAIRTSAKAPQPDYLPPNGRRLFVDYLGSRYNLARYLLREKKAAEALALVLPVIELNPYIASDEQTTAPFHFIAAQAHELQQQNTQAYEHYFLAASINDPQQRFALQAQARLQELKQDLSAERLAQLESAALALVLPDLAPPRFSDVSSAAGLDRSACQRIAWADVDGDGDEDLLTDGSQLWLNSGAAGFKDMTRVWRLPAGKTGGTFGDYDNDGDLDLYAYGPGKYGDRLLRNDGTAFADITVAAGSCDDGTATAFAAWLDSDADGRLDLISGAYTSKPAGQSSLGLSYFRNSGAYFVDAGELLAVELYDRQPLASCAGIALTDVNADRLPDAFIARMNGLENLLLLNAGGGAFVNAGRQLACAGDWIDGAWGHSIAADTGDFNADGLADLLACNVVDPNDRYHSPQSQLLLATADSGGFTNASPGFSIDSTVSEPCIADFNCDGLLDIFLTASGPGRPSSLYLQSESGWYEAAYASGARISQASGCAWADYDSDGDIDIAVCTRDGLHLLRNDSTPANWLEVLCIGAAADSAAQPASNRSAIGTRVTLEYGGHSMLRELQSAKGGGCGNQLLAHFGIGIRGAICSLTVEFPSGRRVTKSLKPDRQRVTVSEAEGIQLEPLAAAAPSSRPPVGPEPPPEAAEPILRPGESQR